MDAHTNIQTNKLHSNLSVILILFQKNFKHYLGVWYGTFLLKKRKIGFTLFSWDCINSIFSRKNCLPPMCCQFVPPPTHSSYLNIEPNRRRGQDDDKMTTNVLGGGMCCCGAGALAASRRLAARWWGVISGATPAGL